MNQQSEEFYTLTEASKYAHVTRQCIFVAIRDKKLKAEKKLMVAPGGRKSFIWVIKKEDLEEYRRNKHNTDRRKYQGELVYDIEQSRWSVMHASKALSHWLKKPYPEQRIYYFLRTGYIRADKKGRNWVLSADTVKQLYEEALQNSGADLFFESM